MILQMHCLTFRTAVVKSQEVDSEGEFGVGSYAAGFLEAT